ncbi:hypothetical protein A1O1_01599 [Capronia coronata CBS 617.96]|uniref:Uncharacterized protein n=1 Tax=Capronia coronata CBS 617.96 TaxID=1182541 RepID=W9YVD9_9EURO|nr:uncharacterized protein A1O1_01599 [Capronia coronata CBS 617.96]EXJ96473.1 hypothetical protein A1O1_01599 [Capronia coronata CBS 617.96]
MAVVSDFQRYRAKSRLSHRLVSRQQPLKGRRDNGGTGGVSGTAVAVAVSILQVVHEQVSKVMQCVAVIVVLVTLSILFYSFLRRWRIQGKSPRYIPTQFLKKKWRTWSPGGKYSAIRNRDLSSANTAYNGNDIGAAAPAAGVDRNTSVRSVITLPAYSRTPKDTEQVLGREGEREGMDTVVEFPETQDEEETRREDLMESLYQIRVARRREVAEREERRRERREARERGDSARLEELRRQSRLRANQSSTSVNGGATVSAATLLAEHQSRGRERKVTSVAYGLLGEVRHDGTRLRANSNESERGGLLSGAAPMGEVEGRPRQLSDATLTSTISRPRTRDQSISGNSLSTFGSDAEHQARPGSPRARSSHSDGPHSGTTNSSPTANRFTPDESTESDDIGDSRILQSDMEGVNRPPDYEVHEWGDAPAYELAVARRAASNAAARAAATSSSAPGNPVSQLPQLILPSISVSGASEPNTPVTQETEDDTISEDQHHQASQ